MTITASPFNLNWFEFEFEGEEVNPPGDDIFQLQRVVAPQPCADQVNVAFASIFRQDLTMVVYNSQGQLVYGEYFEDTSEFQTTIALEGWASGVYQVFVIREDGTVTLSALSWLTSPRKSRPQKGEWTNVHSPCRSCDVLSRKSCAWSSKLHLGLRRSPR